LDTLFEYIPQDSLVVTDPPEELEKIARETEERVIMNFNSSCDERKLCVEPRQLYLQWSQAAEFISEKKPLTFKVLDVLKTQNQNQVIPYRFEVTVENNTDLSREIKNPREKEELLRPLVKWLTDKQQTGFATLAVCRTQSQAARLDR
jgi:hypothetical protein